jgi:hypothetical protein
MECRLVFTPLVQNRIEQHRKMQWDCGESVGVIVVKSEGSDVGIQRRLGVNTWNEVNSEGIIIVKVDERSFVDKRCRTS